MPRSSIFVVILLLLICSGLYFAYRSLIEAGYESCVLSIEDGIAIQMSASEFREIPLSEEWRTLTEDEERLVFNNFRAAGQRFDCKNFGEYANGDALAGDEGLIKVRKHGQWIRARVEVNDGRVRRNLIP